MTSPSFTVKTLLCAVLAAVWWPLIAAAQLSQAVAVPSRVTQAIDEASVVTLRGNTHPLAQARFDQGAAADSMPMQRMLLVLKRSAAQEATLDSLLDQQQDPTSANYHHWLTPQQFGQQFGPSDQDIQTVTNWLQSHGFTVSGVSNGRTVIEFSGSAGQVREAFHAEIHRYAVNGQSHWANASDPQIPGALSPVVAGVNTLYNFPRRAMHQIVGTFTRSPVTGQVEPVGLQYTIREQNNVLLAVGPADFAKIYNVPNLALSPVPSVQYNGDGETIAIVGDSDINPQDISAFRTLFGLPIPTKLTTIVNGVDPGMDPGGSETEADLDVEWAGAVAPNATIDLVIAQSTESSLGVDLAAQYVVDNNLAPVLNESFGLCEFFMGNADNLFYSQLWQQAAAQGITVTVSAGDGGSATCDQNAGTSGAAQYGLSVSGFTSTPYNVSVGGTDFNDVSNFEEFWNMTPEDSPSVASAVGYVPEMSWNDTCSNQEVFGSFGVTSAEQSCNNATEKNDGLVSVGGGGGGGGMSNCIQSNGATESTCSQGYAKPSWQTGSGVPADGVRDVPDVSLFASNGFNASFYAICEADLNPGATSCDPFSASSTFLGVGGTSASSPAFAAIVALVNQATGQRLGNANYVLYKLASQSGNTCASAASPASTCVFYDVPSGSTIAMPCVKGSPDMPSQTNAPCSTELANDTVGVLSGYDTGSGYDLATGLGSVNATNLINKWMSFASSLTPTTTTLTLNDGNDVNITHGQSVPLSINVTGSGGIPTGTVSLIADTTPQSSPPGTLQDGVGDFALANGLVSASTRALPGGNYTVFAQYPGDPTFASSSSTPPISVSVSPEASRVIPELVTFDTNGNLTGYNANSATYGLGHYLFRVDVGNSTATSSQTGVSSNCLSGLSNCPTGNVSLTAVGGPLPFTTLSLNSKGYAEIQSLSTGTYSITASYAGDSSYSPSSGTAAFTISKAPTTVVASVFASPISLGSDQIAATILTNSTGAAPSGTVTFSLDGSQIIPSAVVYEGFPFNPPGSYATLSASGLATFASVGTHVLSAEYSGDQNYAAGASSDTTITVAKAFPSFGTYGATPNSINLGQQVTLIAALAGAGAGVPIPTGTFTFYDGSSALTGLVTYTNLANGLSGSTPYTPATAGQHEIKVSYSGDTNYLPTTSPVAASLFVTGPTFSVTANPTSVAILAPGQSASTTLTFTSQNGLTGAGSLSSSTCGTSASEKISCALSAFTLVANSTATATLSFNSTAASQIGPSGRTDPPLTPGQSAPRFILLVLICTFAALGCAKQRKQRRWQLIFAAILFTVVLSGVSCGGGGGNGTSGGTGGTGGAQNTGTPTGAVQLNVSIVIDGVTQSVPNLTLDVQ